LQLKLATENLNTKLLEKGKEVKSYQEKYQIQFHRQGQVPPANQLPSKIPEEEEPPEQTSDSKSSINNPPLAAKT